MAHQLHRELDHFLTLARRGQHPGASDAEQQATRLAKAILDNSPGLDSQARYGAAQIIEHAAAEPETLREVMRLCGVKV